MAKIISQTAKKFRIEDTVTGYFSDYQRGGFYFEIIDSATNSQDSIQIKNNAGVVVDSFRYSEVQSPVSTDITDLMNTLDGYCFKEEVAAAAVVTSVTASSPLQSTGGNTPDISIVNGTAANDVLQWDGSTWNATQLSIGTLTTTCAADNLLRSDGTNMVCGGDAIKYDGSGLYGTGYISTSDNAYIFQVDPSMQTTRTEISNGGDTVRSKTTSTLIEDLVIDSASGITQTLAINKGSYIAASQADILGTSSLILQSNDTTIGTIYNGSTSTLQLAEGYYTLTESVGTTTSVLQCNLGGVNWATTIENPSVSQPSTTTINNSGTQYYIERAKDDTSTDNRSLLSFADTGNNLRYGGNTTYTQVGQSATTIGMYCINSGGKASVILNDVYTYNTAYVHQNLWLDTVAGGTTNVKTYRTVNRKQFSVTGGTGGLFSLLDLGLSPTIFSDMSIVGTLKITIRENSSTTKIYSGTWRVMDIRVGGTYYGASTPVAMGTVTNTALSVTTTLVYSFSTGTLLVSILIPALAANNGNYTAIVDAEFSISD